jgi:hypothetical protein
MEGGAPRGVDQDEIYRFESFSHRLQIAFDLKTLGSVSWRC